MTTGTKSWVALMAAYLVCLRSAARSAAAPGVVDVRALKGAANVSGQVTSDVKHLPTFQGTSVIPFDRLPSDLKRPIGSLDEGTPDRTQARHNMSFNVLCLIVRPALLLQHKPCMPRASTKLPHGHRWGAQTFIPSLRPIATLTLAFLPGSCYILAHVQMLRYLLTYLLIASSSSLRPQDETGIAWIQSPLCEARPARKHAWPTSSADIGMVSLLGLLNMSAAFGTVDHDILIFRLETSFGIMGTALAWLQSFLAKRTQQVVFNGHSSSKVTVASGVPQGSVLGPLLFLLYTADIPLIASEHRIEAHVYADDGQLYLFGRAGEAESMISRVTECIADIDTWMSSNRLKLNSDKTQFIWLVSRYQRQKVDITSIQPGISEVKFQSNVNDLGVIIDDLLSMKDHV